MTTDIRRYFGDDANAEMIKDGNSIFIFEVAGLCIGLSGTCTTSSTKVAWRQSGGSTS